MLAPAAGAAGFAFAANYSNCIDCAAAAYGSCTVVVLELLAVRKGGMNETWNYILGELASLDVEFKLLNI